MRDILEFERARAAGRVEIARLNDAHIAVSKRYDEATGDEVAPEVMALDVTQLQQQRAEMVQRLAALDGLIADLLALRDSGTRA